MKASVRLPARGSFLETLLTSLVSSAAVICWINALLDDGLVGAGGIVIVALAAGWVFVQRTRRHEPPERPFLIGGSVALGLGIVFQVVSS
jgi:hypothetical protein